MWTQGNYRRLFLDMHIDDSDEVYFSKLDPDKIFETLKETGTQMITVKGTLIPVWRIIRPRPAAPIGACGGSITWGG